MSSAYSESLLHNFRHSLIRRILILPLTLVFKGITIDTRRFPHSSFPIESKYHAQISVDDKLLLQIGVERYTADMDTLPLCLVGLTAVILLIGIGALGNVALKKPYKPGDP